MKDDIIEKAIDQLVEQGQYQPELGLSGDMTKPARKRGTGAAAVATKLKQLLHKIDPEIKVFAQTRPTSYAPHPSVHIGLGYDYDYSDINMSLLSDGRVIAITDKFLADEYANRVTKHFPSIDAAIEWVQAVAAAR